jgi:hypothetical protein
VASSIIARCLILCVGFCNIYLTFWHTKNLKSRFRPSTAVVNPAVHTHFFRLRWQQAAKSCTKKQLALHKQGRDSAFLRFLSLALANFRANVAVSHPHTRAAVDGLRWTFHLLVHCFRNLLFSVSKVSWKVSCLFLHLTFQLFGWKS